MSGDVRKHKNLAKRPHRHETDMQHSCKCVSNSQLTDIFQSRLNQITRSQIYVEPVLRGSETPITVRWLREFKTQQIKWRSNLKTVKWKRQNVAKWQHTGHHNLSAKDLSMQHSTFTITTNVMTLITNSTMDLKWDQWIFLHLLKKKGDWEHNSDL